MVRPRKAQIQSRNTRFTKVVQQISGQPTSLTIPAGTLNPLLVTEVSGGVEEDISAVVRGTVTEPYTIVVSDALSISINGATSVIVTLGSADIIASKVVVRINDAVGFELARNDEGKIILVNATVGSDTSIGIFDSVPGTLAKFGIPSGLVTGRDASIRGAITDSIDLKGGFVPLNAAGGQQIINDTDFLVSLFENPKLLGRVSVPNIAGGFPVHGRLLLDDSGDYEISFYSKMPQKAELFTGDSDFSSLDATDSFTIGTDVGPVVPIDFPAGAATAAAVADRVNVVWNLFSNVTTGLGNASIRGSVTAPFKFDGEDLVVKVDGGSQQSVLLSASDILISDFITAFNIAITGATASPFTDGDGNTVVNIVSDNTDGRTSSIEIVLDGSYGNLKLGLPVGLYKGLFIADVFGVNTVRFTDFTRGSTSKIIIGGVNPTTLIRLGITAGSTSGSDIQIDEPVSIRTGSLGTLDIELAIPEMLEFGDIDPAGESDTERFNESSNPTLSETYNFVAFKRAEVPDLNPVIVDSDSNIGLGNQGKLPYLDSEGQIPINFTLPLKEFVSRFLKKITQVSAVGDGFDRALVTNLVSPGIETPGTGGNTLPESNRFIIDLDPAGTFSDPFFSVRHDRDNAPRTAFSIRRSNTVLTDWIAESGDGVITFAWGNTYEVFRLFDVNTRAAGVAASGDRFLSITSPTARTVRIGEAESPNTSLLDAVNARFAITCGDGILTFGDFNGDFAIQEAVAFAIANSLETFKIQIKSGLYSVESGGTANIDGTIDPSNGGGISGETFTFEGIGPDVIIALDSGITGFEIGANTIIMKNVSMETFSPPWAIGIRIGEGGKGDLDNCQLFGTQIKCDDAEGLLVRNCVSNTQSLTSDLPNIELRFGDGSSTSHKNFIFTNCVIDGGDNQPICLFGATGPGVPLTLVDSIIFRDCSITTASTTINGDDNLVGNPGLFDVDPDSNNAFEPTNPRGVGVDRVVWENCKVDANSSGGPNTILIHLKPVATGAHTAASPYEHLLNDAVKINNVSILGGVWSCPDINSEKNPFTIVGVGLPQLQFLGFAEFDGTLTIKDFSLRLGSLDISLPRRYGGPTQDTNSFCTSILDGSPWGSFNEEFHGAMAVMSGNLVMENIRISNCSRLSGSGELFIKAIKNVKIDGLTIRDYKNGSTGSLEPNSRVRFRMGAVENTLGSSFSPFGSNVIVSNMNLNGTNSEAGEFWTRDSGGLTGAILSFEPANIKISFTDCSIGNFTQQFGSNTGHGFSIPSVVPGDLYPGSGPLGASGRQMGALSLTRFNISFIADCFSANWLASETRSRSITIRECEMRNNSFNQNSGHGIIISKLGGSNIFENFGKITLLNNYIHDHRFEGILIRKDLWNEERDAVIMSGNDLERCGRDLSNTSIKVAQTDVGPALSERIVLSAFGNKLFPGATTDSGFFNIEPDGLSTNLATTTTLSAANSGLIVGCETAIQNDKEKVYSFISMLHNVAELRPSS